MFLGQAGQYTTPKKTRFARVMLTLLSGATRSEGKAGTLLVGIFGKFTTPDLILAQTHLNSTDYKDFWKARKL